MANNFPTIKPSLNLQFSNTGALPPDVTFTRASSSGGYYDGKTVAKAEENLFLHSEAFDNAYWSKFQATVDANTAETTDPLGTNTADKMTTTSTSGSVNRSAFSAGTFTLTIYAKEGTGTSFAIDDAFGANGRRASFDLSAGTTSGVSVLGTGGTSSGGTASITDVGGGWYRCVFSEVTNSVGIRPIFECLDNLASVYLWGAQLEQRSSITAYTPTTTQPITNFVPKLLFAPAGVPVFDHNPITGEALGLSVWEARTNLLQRSEEFDNAYWTKTDSIIEANQIIAPDGTLTADKFIPASSAFGQYLTRSTSGSGAFIFSIFAKKAEFTYLKIRLQQGTVALNLDTGAVTGNVGTFQAQSIGNGWYRLSASRGSLSGGWVVRVWGSNSATLVSVFDDEVVTDADGYKGVYIWGAQLEAGAFATPYIPTVGSTVARSADAAVMTGENFSRWFRADEGTFVIEAADAFIGDGSIRHTLVNANDGGANSIRLGKAVGGGPGSTVFFAVAVGGADQAYIGAGTIAANVPYTVAGAYKVNDFATTLNGGTVATDTSGILPAPIQMNIGATPTGLNQRSGGIKSIQYYPARLTNDNLVAVTQ